MACYNYKRAICLKFIKYALYKTCTCFIKSIDRLIKYNYIWFFHNSCCYT